MSDGKDDDSNDRGAPEKSVLWKTPCSKSSSAKSSKNISNCGVYFIAAANVRDPNSSMGANNAASAPMIAKTPFARKPSDTRTSESSF
jgi:hypothetical protein